MKEIIKSIKGEIKWYKKNLPLELNTPHEILTPNELQDIVDYYEKSEKYIKELLQALGQPFLGCDECEHCTKNLEGHLYCKMRLMTTGQEMSCKHHSKRKGTG